MSSGQLSDGRLSVAGDLWTLFFSFSFASSQKASIQRSPIQAIGFHVK
jgi:hypothetical protein